MFVAFITSYVLEEDVFRLLTCLLVLLVVAEVCFTYNKHRPTVREFPRELPYSTKVSPKLFRMDTCTEVINFYTNHWRLPFFLDLCTIFPVQSGLL